MTSGSYDTCRKDVRIADGVGDLWNSPTSSSGGMMLELVDGPEHFPYFDCMERLSDDRESTVGDVAAL